MTNISSILTQQHFEKDELVALLACEGDDMDLLLKRALEVKKEHVGPQVHLRGLIELSNICRKSCLYCGIRSDNRKVERYELTDEEVISCARLAHQLGYGSVAIQGGERSDKVFTDRITRLVRQI